MALDDTFSKSLLHFDGVNDAQTFTDESGKTWTAQSVNVKLKTATKQFGLSSCYFPGGAQTDYISTPDSADWAFGTGDYTIDFWMYTPQLTQAFFVYQGDAGSTYGLVATMFAINMGTDANKLRWYANYAASPILLVSTTSINNSVWYHIAAVRYGNVFSLYVNGTSEATATNAWTALDVGYPFCLGGRNNAGYYNGYIDEFRVKKGRAAWIGNFNVPTTPYGPTTKHGFVSYGNPGIC